jgi:hypothetical protein
MRSFTYPNALKLFVTAAVTSISYHTLAVVIVKLITSLAFELGAVSVTYGTTYMAIVFVAPNDCKYHVPGPREVTPYQDIDNCCPDPAFPD